MSTRIPVVAGSFYPASDTKLKNLVNNLFEKGPGLPSKTKKGAGNIFGLLSPHAGYIYSGIVAAYSFKDLAYDHWPKRIFLIGPNHTGIGPAVSVFPDGEWLTPLGKIKTASEVINRLAKSSLVNIDTTAHQHEHSLEVQLPFLQYLFGDSFTLIPICQLDQSLKTSLDLGQSISTLFAEGDLIIASSDMTHYESHDEASTKDKQALQAIEKFNPEKLFQTIKNLNVSMCGYGPTIAMMKACQLLGAKKVNILKYATSGDITGDRSAVVGYASAVIRKE